MLDKGGIVPGEVTEELCKARMETIYTKLDAIQRDGEETRAGVGKIMRRLFEGNGTEALDVQVHKNTDHRITLLRAGDVAKSQQWRARLSWSLAAAGWAFGLAMIWLAK